MMNSFNDLKPHQIKYLKKDGDYGHYECILTHKLDTIHNDVINIEKTVSGLKTGAIITINPDCIVRFDNQKVRLSK